MHVNSHPTGKLRGLVLAALAVAFTGCDAVNEVVDEVRDIGNDAEVHYYLSLGTSLSVGVQPNSTGIVLPTNDGYGDQLFDLIKAEFEAAGANRELRLVKLGCPGETLDKLVDGGSCPYAAGSQLDGAVDFLEDNRARGHLLTIDIGANDFRNAGCISNKVDMGCVTSVSAQIANDLAPVLETLGTTASPATTIIGMNYYNPYLSSWLDGMPGQRLAIESEQAGALFSRSLQATYEAAGIPMADVYTAFASDDFTTMVETTLATPNDILPLAVANICTFTYMCDESPVGPDIHANVAGYGLIAETLASSLP